MCVGGYMYIERRYISVYRWLHVHREEVDIWCRWLHVHREEVYICV